MKKILRTALIGLAAVVLCTFMAFQARAQVAPGTLGTEDPVSGYIGTIPNTLVQVASDGEAQLSPFNITPDVSDAIYLDAQVGAGNSWNIDPNVTGWTQLLGVTGAPTFTWYIDAASVGENEPTSTEPLGIWHSSNPWVPGVIGQYQIMQVDGSVSDVINLYNDANGAVITFQSDPVNTPDPGSTCALLGLALAGLGAARRFMRG